MSPTPQDLEAQIETQRDQLADTVDALAGKLDVKAQARAHATQLTVAGVALAVAVVGMVLWRRRS